MLHNNSKILHSHFPPIEPSGPVANQLPAETVGEIRYGLSPGSLVPIQLYTCGVKHSVLYWKLYHDAGKHHGPKVQPTLSHHHRGCSLCKHTSAGLTALNRHWAEWSARDGIRDASSHSGQSSDWIRSQWMKTLWVCDSLCGPYSYMNWAPTLAGIWA